MKKEKNEGGGKGKIGKHFSRRKRKERKKKEKKSPKKKETEKGMEMKYWKRKDWKQMKFAMNSKLKPLSLLSLSLFLSLSPHSQSITLLQILEFHFFLFSLVTF